MKQIRPGRAPCATGTSAPLCAPDCDASPMVSVDRTAKPRQPLERVGVLWDAIGVPPVTDPFGGSGSDVACTAWVRAHSQHGEGSNIDFISPHMEVDGIRGRFEWLPDGTGDSTGRGVQFVREADLPVHLLTHSYDVLHDTAQGLLRASYIRSRLGGGVFPITCSQYGISYSFLQYGML